MWAEYNAICPTVWSTVEAGIVGNHGLKLSLVVPGLATYPVTILIGNISSIIPGFMFRLKNTSLLRKNSLGITSRSGAEINLSKQYKTKKGGKVKWPMI